MSANRQALTLDHVFEAVGTKELKSVHVELSPDDSGEYYDLRLTSPGPIGADDVNNILNSLWAEWFAKIKVNPVDDCKVTLSSAGEEYSLSISQAMRLFVTGQTPK